METTAEQQQNSSSSANTCCWPLASKYRASTGIYQSLSLLLNAGLMIYAHVGLSAVFVSNQQNIGAAVSANESVDTINANATTTSDTNVDGGSCSVDDQLRWTSVIGPNGRTGADNKTYESSFCSTEYEDPDTNAQCLVDANCIAKCFTAFFNYTESCADCFAAIPLCSLTDGCFVCSGSPQSEECYDCTLGCNQIFQNCSGLSIDLIRRPWETTSANDDNNHTNATTTTEPVTELTSKNNNTNNEQVCAAQKEGVEYQRTRTYHTVFEVLFFESMDIAWKNDARLLAVIVVAFSLVWPYTKNVILMFAWYWPMTEHSRTQILLWLRRLGKYTLIDVFVILILIVGVVLELDLNGVPVVARGEPRPAILAFLVATLWEFVHIEWMVLSHHRTIESSKSAIATAAASASSSSNGNNDNGNLAHAIRFGGLGKITNSTATSIKQFRNPLLLRGFLSGLLLISLALFAVGSSLDLVRFQTALKDDEVGCVRSYNIFTFPTIAVSDLVLHQNDAVIGIWTLVVSFMVFVLVVPWCVHVVHALAFWFGIKSRTLLRTADACWTFSCVDVFLIALYVIEYKFKQLIARLAGEEGAALFEVTSELGPGFFVLVAYTICGGFVHYFFSNAVSEYYALDPHHKVDYIWTILFSPALIVTEVVAASGAVGDNLSATPGTELGTDRQKQTTHKDIAVEEMI